MHNSHESVKMITSSSMHDHAWRLINNQKFIIFVDDFDFDIQDWSFSSDCLVNNFVTIFDLVFSIDNLFIDFNISFINRIFIILGIISFELFGQNLIKFATNPTSFSIGFIYILIRFNKSKRKNMSIDRRFLIDKH